MDISWIEKIGNEYSNIINLFYGQSITQIICGHCKNITHNYEIYSNIMLPITNSTNTLEDCFKLYFKDEFLNEEIEWRCDECKYKVKSKKTIKLWRNPKILIISLKRFTFNLEKNNKIITIPDILDLYQFTLSRYNSKYILTSIAYHYGSSNEGHYVALCKHPDNKWYCIDDLGISEISNIDFGAGYVFFYTLNE